MFKYILDGNLLNLLNKQNKNLDQDFFIKNNIGGLFNIFDQNSDKIVTNNEISSIFNQFKEMAGDNNDVGRVHNVPRKRIIRAKAKVEKSTTNN